MNNFTLPACSNEDTKAGLPSLTASRLLADAVVIRNAAKSTLGCGCAVTIDLQAIYK